MSKAPTFAAPPEPAWVPGEDRRERSRLLRSMRRWGIADLEEFHARSIADPEWFWAAVVEDLNITFSSPFTRVLDDLDGHEFPQWFTGGKLNAAELCSHRHATGPYADKTALVYEGDSGQCRALTYSELDQQVRQFAGNLQQLGVGRGDRVVLFLPVVPEATVAYLACAMIGAISVPAFTGYGAEALAMRLRDSEAVALITADATTRRTKTVLMKDTADEALASAPTVKHVVVVRHLGVGATMQSDRDIYWDELDQDSPAAVTAEMDANDPLTIIYTSGTSGKPKGIVHSHAGFAVKAAVDFAYGFDIHDDDVIAWITDMGWMLGPLLIMGGLQLGATVVMVEGVPTHPSPDRLWQIAGRHQVTFQGIAPTAARAIKSAGDEDRSGLAHVRSFASTGEAWDDSTWQWLFQTVGEGRRPIINYSGGTETGGGILISYPFLPSEPASFNGPLPGMDVAVLDQSGFPIVGPMGEIAVRNTWPGMTHSFWRDRTRYLETYWQTWPTIWHHGDLASVDKYGTWRIHGRSDDTIKVSGRRVGPAEIEAALLKDPRVTEAAVIGIPDEQRGQRVVAFLTVRDEDVNYDDLVASGTHNVGRSFAPTIHIVATLPKTKNGKVMRRVIRARHLGEQTGDLSALDPSTPLTDIPTYQEAGAERA